MTIRDDQSPKETMPSSMAGHTQRGKSVLGAALLGVTLLAATSFQSNGTSSSTDAASWSDALGMNDLLDYYYYNNQSRRRLYHIKGNVHKYLMCTRLMDEADGNYDNSLDLDEYKDFINEYADESLGVTVGDSLLPPELKAVFTEYAEKTEGKSNQIIDIYGSGRGERDGISAHQQDLLESLCNDTSVTLDTLFSQEAKMLGSSTMMEEESTMKQVDHTEAPTPAPKPVKKTHHGPQNVMVNTSFTMTIPDNMTAEDLQHTLETGEDPGGLKDAFAHFVDDVVTELNSTTDANGNGIADVDEEPLPAASNSTVELHGRRDTEGFVRGYYTATPSHHSRRLNIGFDNSSAQIYKFVESPCPGQANAEAAKKTEESSGGLGQALQKLLPGGSRNESIAEEEEEEEEEEEDLIDAYEAQAEEEEEAEEKANEGGRALQMRPTGAVGGTAPQAGDPNADGTMTEEEYVDATEGMSRKELRCVTAMGKFRIQVDEEDEDNEGGLDKIYAKAMSVTKKAVDDGVLEKRLEETPQDNIFHIEGHGVVEDDDFDPYVEVEDNKGLRTVDIILISIGSVLIFCLCCVLCFVELERKTRPRPGL